MQENNKKAIGALAVLLSLLIALGVSLAAGSILGGISNAKDDRVKQAIDNAAEGNVGIEDITPTGEKGVKIYLVKSGTGGNDSYALLSTAKSRGCTAESLVAFSADGVISSVQLLSVEGGTENAMELIEKSGILADLGGASIESESVSLTAVGGVGGCDEALVKSVNQAIKALKSLIAEEEVSE